MSDDWRTRREAPPILRAADEIKEGFVLWSRRGAGPWQNQGHAAINPDSARKLAERLSVTTKPKNVLWSVFPWGEDPNGDAAAAPIPEKRGRVRSVNVTSSSFSPGEQVGPVSKVALASGAASVLAALASPPQRRTR